MMRSLPTRRAPLRRSERTLIILALLLLARLAALPILTTLETGALITAQLLRGERATRGPYELFLKRGELERELVLLRAEREAQRALTGLSSSTSSAPELLVVARPPTASYDTLLIRTETSILPGTLVTKHGFALGTVVRQVAQRAKVQLFSSSGVRTPVLIGATSTPSTIVGAGGGSFRAQVPVALSVVVGDVALLAQDPEYAVAIVDAIESASGTPFANLHLRSGVNLFSLERVQLAETDVR